MIDRQQELRRRLDLKACLAEFEVLSGRTIREDELLPLDLTPSIRERSKAVLKGKPVKKWNVAFRERCSEQFDRFVDSLFALNPSTVYVWTNRANTCGLLQLGSIRHVNFCFDFSALSDGIVVFLTSDLRDNMLLDWEEADGDQRLTVELTGENWPSAKFGNQ